MRSKYTDVAQDRHGNIARDATISVYLAGTLTPATVYLNTTDTVGVTSLTSGKNPPGEYTFYVDREDYSSDQQFKVIVSVNGYDATPIDNIAVMPVIPTSTVLDTDATAADNLAAFNAAIAAATAGSTWTIPFGSYPMSGLPTVNKALTINAYGVTFSWASDTSANRGVRITASNVKIFGLTLDGPQYAASVTTQHAIFAYGASSSAYISGLKIKDCTINDWGYSGIRLRFVNDFEIAGNYIRDTYHSAIQGLSVYDGRVHHNLMEDIITAAQPYGVSMTLDAATGSDLTTDPPSRDVLVDHNIARNITWTPYDTHGGIRIKFNSNIAIDCTWGVALLSTDYTDGDYAPGTDCSADGNILVTTITDAGYGLTISGNASNTTEHCALTNNIVSGYGHENGAVRIVYDNHSIITGNTIYNSGAAGIYSSRNSYDFLIANNNIDTIIATHQIAGIYLDAATVSGVIRNNNINATGAEYGIKLGGSGYQDIDIYGNRLTGHSVRGIQLVHLLRTNWRFVPEYDDVSTNGTGEDTLQTNSIVANSLGTTGHIRVTAAGTKTGANGNKTIKFYFGTASVTFNAAANDVTDWRFQADIANTAAGAQRMTWVGWNGTTMTQGYEALTQDTTADVTMKITGECAHTDDVITQTMWILERLYEQ